MPLPHFPRLVRIPVFASALLAASTLVARLTAAEAASPVSGPAPATPASTAAATAATPATAVGALTAQQVIDRLQKQTGLEWRGPTVDTFKAGDPATPVKGIALVMMSTHEVLQRAVAAGANLIITHEPTYYSGQDNRAPLEAENDQVLATKQAYIREHGLVIFRFHDYMHRMQPDMVVTGVIKALGWQQYQLNNGPKLVIPEITLEALAAQISAKLKIKTLRVVGDPQLKITKLGFSPGASGFAANRRALAADDVEALLFGEATEWETIEYGTDAIAQGRKKALIILGHIPSEEAGMIECTAWLKTFVPEVPVQFIATPEPFWYPKANP